MNRICSIILLLMLTLSSALFAENEAPNIIYTPPKTTNQFNVQAANRTLDKLTIKLSIQNLNAGDLETAVGKLTGLQTEAKECVANSETELKKINTIWAETPTEIKNEQDLTSLQKYLKQKRDDITALRSECRLFVLRSGEAITAFGKTVETLKKEKLLQPEPNYWFRLFTNMQFAQQLYKHFNNEIFTNNSGLKKLNVVNGSIALLFLLLTLLLGLKIRKLCQKVSEVIPTTTIGGKLKYALLRVLRRYSPAFMLMFALSIITTSLGLLASELSLSMLASYALLGFIVSLMLVQFLFYPYHNENALSGLTPQLAKTLVFRTKSLLSLCLIAALTYIALLHQLIPNNITDFIRTIFITLLAINLISILLLVTHLLRPLHQHKIFRYIINTICTLLLIGLITTEWLGYQKLVTFILRGIALTLILTFIALLLYKSLSYLIYSISASRDSWQEKIREYLKVKTDQTLTELVGLRILFFILIWGTLILMLLKTWGLSPTQFNELTAGITKGFIVGGIHFVPSRILGGLLFFILTLLFVRWLSAVIEHNEDKQTSRGSKIALAAIVGYVGFAIVLLLALLIAGVSFAGLAIIAGALSVGIGFGLQNIVNNFVSGLILLIEKPIRPGDRIMIGDTEGFVKKISIRYTQIQTLSFSDLIVPNAEIVSKQVTNFMFKDFYGRVTIAVGVVYQSDIQLVKELLLSIAKNHPEVVSEDGPYQPTVIFSDFGDNSLKFNLYAVIRNVNLRYIVASELRFEIEKVFNENGIVIAFPQRDVHIKDWTKMPLPEK